MIETYFEIVQQLWLDLQQGMLPDFGGWNYMLMAMLIMIQGRSSAIIGGIAAAAGYLDFGLVILVAIGARLIVDLFWYRIGFTGLIDKVGRIAAPYRKYSGQVNDNIYRRPTRFVLFSKVVGGLSAPLTMAVGNARVPIRRWLPASLLGDLLWTLPLLLVGFFATDALTDIKGGLLYITAGSLTLMLLFAAAKKTAAKLKPALVSSK